MADTRIINPTHANPCTVRQMTDEEKARYGQPAPVPKRIQLMRAKAKANTEKGYADSWNDAICMESFDRPNPIDRQGGAPMANNLGPKVDRVRMWELFHEHGTDNTAVKKIAGELGCSRQTVDAVIRKEKVRERLSAEKAKAADVEVTPTVVAHITPDNGFIPALKVEDLESEPMPERTPINSVRERFICNFIPDSGFTKTLAEIEADIDAENLANDGMKAAAVSVKDTPEPDAAYYAALDDIAKMYTNEPEFRKHTTKEIAKEGLRGLHQIFTQKNVTLWESLKSSTNPSGVELSSLLMQIANSAVQGLMFLESLEEW